MTATQEIEAALAAQAQEPAMPANDAIKWVFELGQTVSIEASGESGEVIGRAQFAYFGPSYLVRYAGADGRAVEAWWTQTALVTA